MGGNQKHGTRALKDMTHEDQQIVETEWPRFLSSSLSLSLALSLSLSRSLPLALSGEVRLYTIYNHLLHGNDPITMMQTSICTKKW